MPFIDDWPEEASLLDLFRTFPRTSGPLIDYHEELMRGDSPLTPGERELIAAYVSGLNACAYCHGVHTATAEQFGMPDGLLESLLEDIDSAPVDERLKPILRYVRKLTTTPSRMTRADAEAVFAAGWDGRALHDAVSVCALFNFMNRLVEGVGIKGNPRYFEAASRRLAGEGYDSLKDITGIRGEATGGE